MSRGDISLLRLGKAAADEIRKSGRIADNDWRELNAEELTLRGTTQSLDE
jgi:hypothetical protein